MLRVALVAMLSFLTLPAAAQTPTTAAPRADQSAQELPSGAQRFSGMIVGRLVAKDVEKGTFVLNVDAVPRVWKNSKAENPKSMVGKRLAVEGVFGKWLDALLLVKEGETLECEARHDGGANLAFLGETLRKVAPFKPGDYPELPEAFRGFNGKLQAKVVKKSSEMLEVIVEVKQVLKVGEGSSAKQPESIVGKQVMLGGFWQRKDAYHQLKVGDLLDLQVQHIGRQSDHLTVREFGRTSATESTSDATRSSDSPNSVNAAGLPKAFHGFLGSLVGTLVDKDVEKGTFTVKVQAVPRVWKRNRAGNPKSIIGQEVVVEGLASRFLDVLLTTRKGETLEVAARHDGGAQLAFAGEMFRKVAPYQADDYPVLAEAFRGFQGNVTATIVKKDPMLYGLIVKIESVGESREGNRAKQAESMVGKTAILAGFWQRKEQFAGLQVGDRIQTGAKHEVAGSDVLMAVETLRKLGAE